MDQTEKRDDALFEELNRKRKRKKRKLIRTIVILLAVTAILLVSGILYLRRQVAKRFSGSGDEVISAEAALGSISTQVSGSGTLVNVDEESLTAPAGVTIEDILVSANDTVKKGQLLAKTDSASVLAAMDSLQEELSSIDGDITSAASDTVSSYITAGVAGRVKQVFARNGDDVVACMHDHGALAVLSLDGYMELKLEDTPLQAGDDVTVLRSDGSEFSGKVDSLLAGTASILVSDELLSVGEEVSVLNASGSELGTGTLSIHSPMRISGISGTVSHVYISENRQVYAGTTLFSLTNTSYTARYQTLVKEREELEDSLLELMEIYKNGGVAATIDGSVSSIDYDETAVSSDAETAVATLSPDISMQVTLNVDESNILSLELGQTASVTVSSIGDEAFTGSVTEINKTASSSSGVTRYSAVVTLDKTAEMLQGMSAKIVIRIQGVENAVIIPIEALHQTSSSSYVYTSYDEELKEYGGLKEVTVGITNSSYAEITSGLEAGEIVWYTESASDPFGNMGFPEGGNGFGGGSGVNGDFSGGPGGNGSPGGSGFGGGGNSGRRNGGAP